MWFKQILEHIAGQRKGSSWKKENEIKIFMLKFKKLNVVHTFDSKLANVLTVVGKTFAA